MALTINGELINTKPFKKIIKGNLYRDMLQPSLQMNYTYYKPLKNIFVDNEGNLRDPEVPRARGSILLPEATAAYPDLKDMSGRYNIASNDAIVVVNGRPVNMHLRKTVDEGVKKYAARAQDNPYLHMAGVAASAIPLAVAAAPAVIGGGELAAAALANPYIDAGITSAFAGHGLNHAINEGIGGYGDAFMTALELTPLGRIARPMWNASKEGLQYTAKVADNITRNVFPSYDLYRTIEQTTPRVSLGYDTLLKNYNKLKQVVPTNEIPVLSWREATKPSVNWNADNWFKTISGRSSYSSEEAAELASHVPEYRAIEQRLFDEDKLALDSNGNIIVVGSEMSPQEYIMRQSEAFQKMNPEHHYVGVKKELRNSFENESRDPQTKNRYEVWTDRKDPKNVEEYAYSGFDGETVDSRITRLKKLLDSYQNENGYNNSYWKRDLKEAEEMYKSGQIDKQYYDDWVNKINNSYNEEISRIKRDLEATIRQKETDPLNGGKVFDVTYPKGINETPIINAEGRNWAEIPYEYIERDAPDLISHYKGKPHPDEVQTDVIVNMAKRHGYPVTHIDNVMDTGNGTLLNETIINKNVPVKSVLGNTGSFDISSFNRWKLYRSLLPPFLGLGAAGTLYKNLK